MLWSDELFEEKDFWQVYVKARRVTGSCFNKVLSSIVFLVLLFLVVVEAFGGGDRTLTSSILVQWVRDWASLGVAYTTGILGFLVAGFSIFATITKNALFVTLAKIPYKDESSDVEISQLKFIFFNFLIVFIHYIAFLGTCIFIGIFLSKDGLLTTRIAVLTAGVQNFNKVIAGTAVVALGTWFVVIVLMLKSFIWNLYQSVLFTIVAEAEIEERKK